jgi:hypothetical protein
MSAQDTSDGSTGSRLPRWRIWTFAAGSALMLAIAGGYGLHAAHRHDASIASTAAKSPATATLPLDGPPHILYISTAVGADYEHLAEVQTGDPAAGLPTVGPLGCERTYAAADTLVCLRAEGSLVATQYAEVYRDSSGTPQLVQKIQLPGIPSRTRVSADGQMVAWTVFVSGDSYNGPQFSTRTGVLDVKTGKVIPSLETFTAYVDGAVYRKVDINYWGITFEKDDAHFYVTMGSAGHTWLMLGDLATKSLRSVTENVECPSLSPDGTHIVFKKRISNSLTAPWRLYVLDLKTLQESPLAETRSIDDQASWLGNDEVMYQVPQTSGPGYDIWEVPANGSGTPKLLIQNGFSPVAVGGQAG